MKLTKHSAISEFKSTLTLCVNCQLAAHFYTHIYESLGPKCGYTEELFFLKDRQKKRSLTLQGYRVNSLSFFKRHVFLIKETIFESFVLHLIHKIER